MLTERITTIFRVLGCSNTDIAKFAGCSPSNIRLIHTNKRKYSPEDKPVALIANGIFSFADAENLLPMLTELCHADGVKREILVPSIIAWLFEADEKALPDIKTLPERKRNDAKKRSFGEKLDLIMSLLELSNARLARSVKVDDSYISRFRGGMRSPVPDSEIARSLASTLFGRTSEQNRTAELARLSGIPFELLSDYEQGLERFTSWLYDIDDSRDAVAIDRLLECIDSFSPQTKIPLPELSSFLTNETLKSRKKSYTGIEGLREAVIRFLGNTVTQGGELWLYSDESLDWMVGDKSFFVKWYALMHACVKRGVKVRIIHNIDRGTDEMISAIQSWMPLYMSGMIEPYICRKGRDTRFSHTIFLRPGAECISAFHISSQEKTGYYEYITESDRLSATLSGLNTLFSLSEPLLHVFIGDGTSLFSSSAPVKSICSLLPSLSLGTLPEKLLSSMLACRNVSKESAERISEFCAKSREILAATLEAGSVYEFIPLPDDTELFANKVRLNLAPSLSPDDIFYTPEEYAEHARAVAELLHKYTSYHFYAIPELPFDDIQLIAMDKKVTVIKSSVPRAAFVFYEPTMLLAFGDYFDMLKRQNKCDRVAVRQRLYGYI